MNIEKENLLNKKRKRDKILSNFTQLEAIFKTEKAQKIFNSFGVFSFEEYSKFFQNVSNKEYISLNENKKKNKDPISIDKSKLNLDYNSLFKNDKKIIDAKEIIKSNLQPKGISKRVKGNINKITEKKIFNFNDTNLYLNSITENITNIINSRSEIDKNIFKNLIKLYSKILRFSDKFCIENKDEIFSKLLLKYLKNNLKDFFNLSSFWLNFEYLLCQEKTENNNEIIIYKRFDDILRKIVDILLNQIEEIKLINNVSDFSQFISEIPLYNGYFIDFLSKFQKAFLDYKKDELNEKLKNDSNLTILDVIPFLENIKYIYINVINSKNLIDIKEKDIIRKTLLENFLLLTRNKKYLNAKSLEFIFNEIYNISKFEENVIKDFGIKGFIEIKEIKELNEENKEKIEERLFFYFSLCKKNNENIIILPSIYSELEQKIKDMMNSFLDIRFKELIKQNELYYSERLIKDECNEKSEEIVINIIKNIYGNPNYKYENRIDDEKLYRNIKEYYKRNINLTKGIIELSNKIPLKDFFASYNFILDKIDQYNKDNNSDIINELFEQINSKNTNKNILDNINNSDFFENINNKIFFHILYFFKSGKNEEKYKLCKNLMIKFHIKKLIELKKDSSENYNKEISIISNIIINDEKINLAIVFNVYDDYIEKKNINSEEDILNEEFDKIIINYINEKIKTGNNYKLLEDYYKKLSEEKKKEFKNNILKNIDTEAKGNFDLILFGDI